MKPRSVRACFTCILAALAFSNSSRAEIIMEFRGFIDSSIAPSGSGIATTAYAANGDAVYYRVALADSLIPNEPYPGLFVYTPLSASIQVGSQTYAATTMSYTGFHNYVNPAIGTYNGATTQDDTYIGNLAYGQFAFYNLVGAQTTDSIGVLQPSGLIPAPGANPLAGYNLGILHFIDSQTPQSHTYWRVTEYSVVPEPSTLSFGLLLLISFAVRSSRICRNRPPVLS
jgi:hypothetical protein